MTQLHFGFWTILDPTLVKRRVLCRCACGIERRVYAPDLRRGKSKQCRRCASVAVRAAYPVTTPRSADGKWWCDWEREDAQWVRDADGTIRRAA